LIGFGKQGPRNNFGRVQPCLIGIADKHPQFYSKECWLQVLEKKSLPIKMGVAPSSPAILHPDL